jgi:hypothetical protein
VKKKKRPIPVVALTPQKSDEEYSFSEDALNLVVVRLPPGYSILVVEQPDDQLAKEEDWDLLKKVVPKILGNDEMAAVFNLMTFDNESVSTTAAILKATTGKPYTLKAVRTLYDRARQRIRLSYERAAREVRQEERTERARNRGGNVQ